jgi:hypothetical protein
MRVRAQALASDPHVEAVALEALSRTNSAVSAVAAAFFHAAGAYDEVLLAPASLLVVGVGMGARSFDGRLRQPGLGAKRPRGFVEEEAIPPAARVALPTSVAAISLGLAYQSGGELGPIVRPGVLAAERAGKERRAALLQRIGAVGALALTESSFMQPLLHVASPSEGGLLSPADFAPSIDDLSAPARERREGGQRYFEAPFAPDVPEHPTGTGHGVCAIDGVGVFAALCYTRIEQGLPIPALELIAAQCAVPVRRGEPRVRPGTRLPEPSPAAIRCDETGSPLEVAIAPLARHFDPRARPLLTISRQAARWVEASRH